MKPISKILELIKSEYGQEVQEIVLEKIGEVLEKGAMRRLAPYNPRATSYNERVTVKNWQHLEGPRAAVPELTGNARIRALRNLGKNTKTRRNKDTGELEFLLHRGMSHKEYSSVKNVFGRYNYKTESSWTPDIKIANEFSVTSKPIFGKKGKVLSSWISESSIHHIPNILGSGTFKREHEVIVKPHVPSLADTADVESVKSDSEQQLKSPDLNTRINARASIPKENIDSSNPRIAYSRIAKIESFLDKTSRDEIINDAQFQFEKVSEFKKNADEFLDVTRFINTLTPHGLTSLRKALDPKDWSKISKRHSQEATETVDHSSHIEKSSVPQAYKDIVESPNKQKGLRGAEAPHGISSKMVHKVPTPEGHDTYMTKTYHRNPESATRSWVKSPILGWATMATSALFNSAGIGHLIEEVHTHEHDGVQTTVHKFSKGFKNASHLPTRIGPFTAGGTFKGAFRSDDLKKMSIMDFLMNNNDRHGGNLMFSEQPDATDGMTNILGVDHERNFQYHKPVAALISRGHTQLDWSASKDWLAHYKKSHGIREMWRYGNDEGNDALHEWWTGNHQKISDEMLNQVRTIKDDHVRKHVWDNFHHRMEEMNKWANSYTDSYEDPFDTVSVRMLKDRRPAVRLSTSLKMLNNENHIASVETLVSLAKKHTKRSHKESIDATFDAMLGKMTPHQIVEIYQKFGHGILGYQNINYAILSHLKRSMSDSKNSRDVAKSLLSLNTSQPEGSNFILPFWEKVLKEGLVQ